jgi:hypothetical protein
MMTTAIPARLEFQCGHAALVSLPRIKGESVGQRNDRVAREKTSAQSRSCDFCGPAVVVAFDEPPVADVVALEALPVADVVALEALPVAEVAVFEEPLVTEAAIFEAPLAADVIAFEAPVADSEPSVDIQPEVPPVVESVATPVEAPVLSEQTPLGRKPRAARANGTARTRTNGKVHAPVVTQPARTNGKVHAPVAAQFRFTVSYQVDRVILAADVRDALRQAQSLGATEVLAITQGDR